MKMRAIVLWLVAAGMLMGTEEAAGETPEDTIQNTLAVTVRGDLAAVEMVLAEVSVPELRIGQSATIIARAVDSDGDPVPADFFWEIDQPENVALEVTSDSTAVVTGLHKTTGPVIITLTAVDPVEVRIAGFRAADGELLGIDEIDLACAAGSDGGPAHLTASPETREEVESWCSADLCAYAIRGGRMVLQSAPPPSCPLLWPAVEEPARPLSERIRPFAVLAQALRPGPDLGQLMESR